jgi:hypothetical protein
VTLGTGGVGIRAWVELNNSIASSNILIAPVRGNFSHPALPFSTLISLFYPTLIDNLFSVQYIIHITPLIDCRFRYGVENNPYRQILDDNGTVFRATVRIPNQRWDADMRRSAAIPDRRFMQEREISISDNMVEVFLFAA